MPLPPLGRSRQRPLLPPAQPDLGTPARTRGRSTRTLSHMLLWASRHSALSTRSTWHKVRTTGLSIPIWAQMYLEKRDCMPQYPLHRMVGYMNRAPGTRPHTWLIRSYVRACVSWAHTHVALTPPLPILWTSQTLEKSQGTSRDGRALLRCWQRDSGYKSAASTTVPVSCIFLSYPLQALT